jgi:hypothetical protein
MGDRLGDYRIERMSLPDVEIAIDWAAREGWNPGLNDAACFHAIDPKGFFLGMLDGRTIATGLAPIYDAQFAFIGLYIVEPAYRGSRMLAISTPGWTASRPWPSGMPGSAFAPRIALSGMASRQ